MASSVDLLPAPAQDPPPQSAASHPQSAITAPTSAVSPSFEDGPSPVPSKCVVKSARFREATLMTTFRGGGGNDGGDRKEGFNYFSIVHVNTLPTD